MTEITLNRKFEPLFKETFRYAVITGGRGSGKSFATSLWLAMKFMDAEFNFIYLREFLANAAASIIPQFLQQVRALNASFHQKNAEVINDFGKKLYFRGFHSASNSADSNLKSLTNLAVALIDEATEVKEEEFVKLDLSLRDKGSSPKTILVLNPSSDKHWIYKRFFSDNDVQPGFNGLKDDILYIHTTYEDNLQNLDESFIKEAERVKKFDLRKFSNVYLGEWMDSEANALFNQKHLDLAKAPFEGERGYTVVAIDPAVTANKDSDETAIVKAYKSGQDFVIEEVLHGIWTPNEWAKKAIDLADDANEMVYEANQGGLLVENALKNAGCTKKISAVHASKGKLLRAEPIEVLYAKGQVHHMKSFEQLEKEMVTFTGSSHDKSPNCLDAAVWALTSLKSRNTFQLKWA